MIVFLRISALLIFEPNTKTNPMRAYLLSVFVAIFTANAFGQLPKNIVSQIDDMLVEKYTAEGAGAAILITKGGKTIYSNAMGKASIELNVDLSTQHLFEIGSITKQFTAVAVLMLAEEGKLNIEDEITKHLPDYPMMGYTITIHHLMNHTSGIQSYTDMATWAAIWRLEKSVDEMIDVFKNEPMQFEPGTQWAYNNSGYFLLGAIIEKVSGMPYAEFLQEKIFTPLGMRNTRFGSRKELIMNRAAGYDRAPNGFFDNAEFLSMSHPYAAGAIMSTVGDMAIWMEALKANKLISAESLKKAWTNYTLANGEPTNYGYGFMVNEINGSPTIEHSGGIFGYSSNGIYLPQEDLYTIILTNCSCNSPYEFSTRIAALAIGKPYTDPAPIVLTDTELDEYVGIYAFEDGSTRTITRDKSQLYSQRTGGSKTEIYPYEKDKFYFEDSFTQLIFERNNMKRIGRVITKNRGELSTAKRTNRKIEEKIAVQLPIAQLERLTGTYQLAPNFMMEISVENGSLIGQATGQPAFTLSAQDQLHFFLTVVEAEIEFVEDEDGQIVSLILYQGGQKVPGKKVR